MKNLFIVPIAMLLHGLVQAAPIPAPTSETPKYFKGKWTVTNTYHNNEKQSFARDQWVALFQDGVKTYSFTYSLLNGTDQISFLVLQEKTVLPGSTANTINWNISQQFFTRNCSTSGATIKSYSRWDFDGTKQDDGKFLLKDRTGRFPKDAYALWNRSVRADGTEVVSMLMANWNLEVNDLTQVTSDQNTVQTPVSKNELLGALNAKTVIFLNDFSNLNQAAVEITKEINACDTANAGNCSELKKKHIAANAARDKLWTSLKSEDLNNFGPTVVVVDIYNDDDESHECY